MRNMIANGVSKELLDYRGVSGDRNNDYKPSWAVADRLGLQRLYHGMNVVAKEMLVSLDGCVRWRPNDGGGPSARLYAVHIQVPRKVLVDEDRPGTRR